MNDGLVYGLFKKSFKNIFANPGSCQMGDEAGREGDGGDLAAPSAVDVSEGGPQVNALTVFGEIRVSNSGEQGTRADNSACLGRCGPDLHQAASHLRCCIFLGERADRERRVLGLG